MTSRNPCRTIPRFDLDAVKLAEHLQYIADDTQYPCTASAIVIGRIGQLAVRVSVHAPSDDDYPDEMYPKFKCIRKKGGGK